MADGLLFTVLKLVREPTNGSPWNIAHAITQIELHGMRALPIFPRSLTVIEELEFAGSTTARDAGVSSVSRLFKPYEYAPWFHVFEI